MPGGVETGSEFLARVYSDLGYSEGLLFAATTTVPSDSGVVDRWLDIGDWLTVGARMGADKLFFVGNEPVLVFKDVKGEVNESQILEIYRQAWCMAGPQCLFLALPGELRVYALNKPPIRQRVDSHGIEPMEIVRKLSDVAEVLARFSREDIESGRLFGDVRFGDEITRADQRLVSDLRVIRRRLIAEGLRPEHAHALIGRSIFIRYLEDRKVLNLEYFSRVAERDSSWKALLDLPPERPNAVYGDKPRIFDRVLKSLDFTYALFDQLAQDFNGDMFPRDNAERESVDESHLHSLRRFLLGDVEVDQAPLFFWAYDFDIIPISLISSIYEEFYRSSDDSDNNTHYTPSALVDEVLSRTLTPERLKSRPKIIDPACGSGIFLVEAFRRIVRYEAQCGRSPNPASLRRILREQIAGIELNSEAARVAAFSLYLALLNYQEPPEILRSVPLPHLLFDGTRDEQRYGILIAANAFALTTNEKAALSSRLNSGNFVGRVPLTRFLNSVGLLPFELGEFDVVIGNPPWLEAGDRAADTEIVKQANREAIAWSEAFGFPVGDRSYSQLFIHRALSLLNPSGVAGLLVSAKVIWNQRRTSKHFRSFWLESARIVEVINFTHARRVFFDNAVAPFIFVKFVPRDSDEPAGYVVYWSARLTRAAQHLRSVVFTRTDRRLVHQDDLRTHDHLWKTYWWGSHRDAALVTRLAAEESLYTKINGSSPKPGYGFQRSTLPPSEENKNLPQGVLASLAELVSERMSWYGKLDPDWFAPPPSAVKRQPDSRLYQGQRLLLTTGIKNSFGPCVRLENESFSFRHTMYCVPLDSLESWQAKLVLGTIWSALGRYYLFMTSGSWGGWFDKVIADDVLHIPLRLPDAATLEANPSQQDAVRRIVEAVDAIRVWSAPEQYLSLLDMNSTAESTINQPTLEALMAELDKGASDLFALTPSELDLVHDFFTYSFDLLNRGPESHALKRVPGLPITATGTYKTIYHLEASSPQMAKYLKTFLDIWNQELGPDGEFNWTILAPRNANLIALSFETQERSDVSAALTPEMDSAWANLLARCEAVLRQPLSRQLYMDQIVRVVTDTSIILLKRDERRLWSSTAAREDADATLVQAMQLQSAPEVN